jgi:hypothetical protein
MTTTIYAEYKLTSDLDGLPDSAIALCDDCHASTTATNRAYVALYTGDYDCTGCAH